MSNDFFELDNSNHPSAVMLTLSSPQIRSMKMNMNERKLRLPQLRERVSIVNFWKSLAYLVVSLSISQNSVFFESVTITIDKNYEKGFVIDIVTDGALEFCHIMLRHSVEIFPSSF